MTRAKCREARGLDCREGNGVREDGIGNVYDRKYINLTLRIVNVSLDSSLHNL